LTFLGESLLNKYENPAIVIGGGVNGLGIIRNLGRKGVEVYSVVDEKDHSVHSKYCKDYFVLPGVGHDFHKLETFLAKFEHELIRKAVLFPTSDMAAINVSSLIGEMDKYVACISDREVIETLVRKKRFYHSLINRGVPHPRTLFPGEKESLTNIEDEVVFPVFVKPSVSQTFAMRFGRKGFVANSKEELNRYLSLMDKNQIDVMVQEIVAGPPTNHYFIDGYFDRNSRLLAIFARRRLRMWPLDFGNSTTCVSVPISEVVDMKETIIKYLASIGFRGIFSAEFKRDSRDNVGKLLEVNARSWWFNSFPSACGVNIIFTAYLEAIGEVPENSGDYETGKYLIYFIEDLKCSIPMSIQGKLSFREWVSPMLGKKDWVIFANDDLRPFVMNLLQTLKDTVKQRKKIAAMTSKKN